MSLTLGSFLLWSIVWATILCFPPGSTEIIASYRLNFVHGIISSVAAILCMHGILDETFTAMITISYFFIDFVNIVLNDYYFKVKSYQAPTARKVEYFHHILCFVFGVTCELFYKKYCTFDQNPFIKFMLAELSTPVLMAWRHYGYFYLGIIFAVLFFAVRMVYHGVYLVPSCIEKCDRTISLFFGVSYNLLNVVFMAMIIMKLVRLIKGKDSERKTK